MAVAATTPVSFSASYHPRILLTVAGLSPQVLTETIYALARQPEAALPTEVHVLTTREGAERARLTLLSARPGWFARLLREYRLPEITFAAGHIHLLRDKRRRPLPDIRTPEENALLADQVTALVRRFTASAGSQLHVSIAGGRKTMGFYAGYALSLYGRPQDRLSHVLVSPPFESHPEFFFPSRRPRTIFDREGRPLDAARAQVSLAEIPFVRMREQLSHELLARGAGFSATVAALNRVPGPVGLRLRPGACSVCAGGAELRLAPREMAFYLWFAVRRRAGRRGLGCPSKDAPPDLELAREYLAAYAQVGEGRRATVTHRRLAEGMDCGFFQESKSRLNAALRRAGVAEEYHIRRRAHVQAAASFELELPAAAIEMEEGT